MSAVAVSALGFAFLPLLLAGAWATAVSGALALQGIRVVPVTLKGGAWTWAPWVLWLASLLACPAAIIYVGTVYERVGPPAFGGPRPWAARVVDGLCIAHLVMSVVAFSSVSLLTAGGLRWAAWAAVIGIGAVTELFALGAAMATTGIYL